MQRQHKASRQQSWQSADLDIRAFLEGVVENVSELLQPNGFVGAYLHGSLAAGSFYRPKSDLDILFVVENTMPPEQRRRLALAFCDWSDKRPIIGEVETSIVRLEDTKNFHHPLPFEFHYSEAHRDAFRDNSYDFAANNSDSDLAVYCTVIREFGICLKGAPIDQVFGEVPKENYRDAIIDDLEWIIDNENILESPFYAVLNCCRVIEANKNAWKNFLTKYEGGQWALANMPEQFHPIISQSLACYSSEDDIPPGQRRTDGHSWNNDALLEFRDFVRAQNITR